MRRAQELVHRAAHADGPVLLVAEHGVDLQAVAADLHMRGRLAGAPFVPVDCSRAAPGVDRLAAANGGTLFLSDVGELPASAQTRLARVVRDGEAVVDGQTTRIAFRLLAAATPDIDTEARAGRFRSDLYRRLTACRIDVPALRERPEDIPMLVARILEHLSEGDHLSEGHHLSARRLTRSALALLSAMSWPGNLTELADVVERITAGTASEVIEIEAVLPALQLDRPQAPFLPAANLKEARLRFERDYIEAVLRHHGWRMSDAAQTLGIQRPNLYRKTRQLGIAVTRKSSSP